MKNLLIKAIIPICILLFGIAVFIYLTKSKPETETISSRERIWQVKTLTAQLTAQSPSLTLYGKIETPALVNAAAPGKGRVLTISVDGGDKITKGQVLLALDNRDFQARVAREKARVAELKAQISSEQLHYKADRTALKHQKTLLTLQQSAVQRAQQLKNKNMGSTATLELAQQDLEMQKLEFTSRKLNLDDHQSQLQQIQARLDYAQAELDLALLDLERSQVIALFPGYVEKVHVSEGDQVTENQKLLSYYPYDRLEIRAKIPAAYQHELQSAINRGEKLIATTQINNTLLNLELDRLAGTADARGIDALFSLDDDNTLLRLGSNLSLALKRPIQEDAIAVPFSAIYDNTRIYIVKDGRLTGLQVRRLGEFLDQDLNMKMLISSPQLKPGDRIVVTQLPNAVTGLAVNESSQQADTL